MIEHEQLQLYNKGLAVKRLLECPGWAIVLEELEDVRSMAQLKVHEFAHADAIMVKSFVMRWNCIEELIDELKIRLEDHVTRMNGVVEELSTQSHVDDPRIQADIDRLEPLEHDFI